MDYKTFTDNFNLLANAPNGIPKLREMILQLAVMGKLVPQDPNDEPAHVLLQKIAQEKAQLLKEGKIKKQKPLPEISEDEKPFDLPNGWEWVRLGDIGETNIGLTYSPKDISDIGTPVLRANNIRNGKLDLTDLVRVNRAIKNRVIVQEGDLLICARSGSKALVGKTAQITGLSEEMAFGAFMAIFRSRINNYLLYFINSTLFRKMIDEVNTTTINQITQNNLKTTIFPFPPLSEQHRIVSRVDELMALCDELEEQKKRREQVSISMNTACLNELISPEPAKSKKGWSRIRENFDLLYETPQNVAALRQSILQLAVMGKLVPQDPMDLPAPQSGKFYVYALECEDKSIYVGQTDNILKRWKEHATGNGAEWTKHHPPVSLVHWEEYNSRDEAIKREKELKTGYGRKWIKRELAAGRTRQAGEPASILLKKIAKEKDRLIAEGKIKKSKYLPPINHDEAPYDLPEGWEWVRIGEIATVKGGKRIPKGESFSRVVTPHIYLRVTDMKDGTIVDNDLRYISDEVYYLIKNYTISKEDIYITIAGTIGAVGTVPEIFDGMNLTENAAKITFHIVDKNYLVRALSSTVSQAQFFEQTKQQAQPKLALKRIAFSLIPIPPLAEQKRIAAKIDQLMTLSDELESKLQQSLAAGEKLMGAVVAQITER
jgi:restriction endonuclease S subunit